MLQNQNHGIPMNPTMHPFFTMRHLAIILWLGSLLPVGCGERRPLISVFGSDEHMEMFADAYEKVKQHYIDPVPPGRLAMNAIQGMEDFAASTSNAVIKTTHTSSEHMENDEQALMAVGVAFESFAQNPRLDSKLLEQAAIRGMIRSLDPNSVFMTPKVIQEMQIDQQGQVGGVGLQIGRKEGRVVVIDPIEGSPAEKAGIRAGDYIIRINGKATQDLNLELLEFDVIDTVGSLRGPVGSRITIALERTGEPESLFFELVREYVRIETIRSRAMDEKMGYIRITQFREVTPKELWKALRALQAQGIQGCILDLRNNPGGIVTASVEAAELFLGKNKVVFYTKGRQGRKDEWLTRPEGGLFQELRLVVLVNEGTAAGSEIVAGALQDWGRARLVGTGTVGRGTIQTVLPLKGGAALKLTTSRSFTPKGRSVGASIKPDLEVPEQEGRDAPLSSALSDLRTKLRD